jgi:hypothetical protein
MPQPESTLPICDGRERLPLMVNHYLGTRGCQGGVPTRGGKLLDGPACQGMLPTRRGSRGPNWPQTVGLRPTKNDRAKFRFLLNQHKAPHGGRARHAVRPKQHPIHLRPTTRDAVSSARGARSCEGRQVRGPLQCPGITQPLGGIRSPDTKNPEHQLGVLRSHPPAPTSGSSVRPALSPYVPGFVPVIPQSNFPTFSSSKSGRQSTQVRLPRKRGSFGSRGAPGRSTGITGFSSSTA